MVSAAAARVTVYSLVSLAVVGVIYSELQPLINKATGDGVYAGFLSEQISQVNTLIPLLISALAVGIVLWFLVVGAQSERVRQQEPPRRPR
jgi:hypothetical protein